VQLACRLEYHLEEAIPPVLNLSMEDHLLNIMYALERIRSMKKIPILAQLSVLGMLSISFAPCALADSVTVNATDDIYLAGSQFGLGGGLFNGGGTVPSDISASGVLSFTFSVTGGPITINFDGAPFTVYNDADGQGTGVAPTSSTTGLGNISGITAPGQGYLVGVFIGSGGPSGSAPSPLDFTTTNFSTLSPLLDQVFFIGDGMTGDGSGTTQTFAVPTGATELYLGISDATDYNGTPGSYGDNIGTFSVTATPNFTPEPSSLLLFGTGILGMAGVLRRKLLAR
jgi:hypothetical protein